MSTEITGGQPDPSIAQYLQIQQTTTTTQTQSTQTTAALQQDVLVHGRGDTKTTATAPPADKPSLTAPTNDASPAAAWFAASYQVDMLCAVAMLVMAMAVAKLLSSQAEGKGMGLTMALGQEQAEATRDEANTQAQMKTVEAAQAGFSATVSAGSLAAQGVSMSMQASDLEAANSTPLEDEQAFDSPNTSSSDKAALIDKYEGGDVQTYKANQEAINSADRKGLGDDYIDPNTNRTIDDIKAENTAMEAQTKANMQAKWEKQAKVIDENGGDSKRFEDNFKEIAKQERLKESGDPKYDSSAEHKAMQENSATRTNVNQAIYRDYQQYHQMIQMGHGAVTGASQSAEKLVEANLTVEAGNYRAKHEILSSAADVNRTAMQQAQKSKDDMASGIEKLFQLLEAFIRSAGQRNFSTRG